MHKTMMLLQKLDTIMYEAQRQGRISFYLTSHGESAIHIGTASALDANDLVFCQYREAGILIYRGFDINDCCHQIYGNALGSDKGKQAPIHYGSKELNYVTISSTIATQCRHLCSILWIWFFYLHIFRVTRSFPWASKFCRY